MRNQGQYMKPACNAAKREWLSRDWAQSYHLIGSEEA